MSATAQAKLGKPCIQSTNCEIKPVESYLYCDIFRHAFGSREQGTVWFLESTGIDFLSFVRRKGDVYLMDVDLEQVPSQCGTAILEIVDGQILKLTGDMNTEIGRQQCEKLFRVVVV